MILGSFFKLWFMRGLWSVKKSEVCLMNKCWSEHYVQGLCSYKNCNSRTITMPRTIISEFTKAQDYSKVIIIVIPQYIGCELDSVLVYLCTCAVALFILVKPGYVVAIVVFFFKFLYIL